MPLDLGTLEVGRRRKARHQRIHGGHQPANRWGRLQPLGIGVVLFTATSATVLAATQQVQKLFHPKRMIVDISRNGTTATGLVTVSRIDIGADNMLATSGGTGPIPASMFNFAGVDLNLSFSVATPGITITVQLTTSTAPSSTDTIACSVGMLGSTRESSDPTMNF